MSLAPTRPGRRERKKAATHQALADAALRLFLERGYDAVTVREIADAADVSTTTLLKHFPSKEALVFDKDPGIEAGLVAAVAERPPGTPLVTALRHYMTDRAGRVAGNERLAEFMDLVQSSPALQEYWQRMWMRHEDALARAIAADTGAPEDDPRCRALAHLVLDTSAFAARLAEPLPAIEAAFDVIERGWR